MLNNQFFVENCDRFFLTFNISGSIFYLGGDYIHAIVYICISIFISYNLISYYYIKKKSIYITNNKYINKNLRINNYLNKIQTKLNNLGNPYGLDSKKYIIIKYLISIALLIIMYINSNNLFISIILFLSIYFLPNVLIFFYSKNESIIINNEISNIVQNIILSLSANMTFYDSLKSAENSINYDRLKKEYSKFIENYMMYNFNIFKATSIFSTKFNSYDFYMFLSLLSQGEKEGNIIEILESFYDSLQLKYFKNLRYKASIRSTMIIISTLILLINSFAIVLYPIIIEISSSFTEMFK